MVLMIIYSTSFSQDYLQKSKNQKTTAWIMLGGGGALILTGIIIPKGELTHLGILDNDYKNDGIKNAFVSSGTIAMLGSIPFFIMASKNKRKTASFSFKNKKMPQVQKGNLVDRAIPSFNIKINL